MIREFKPSDQAQVINLQEEFMTEFFPEFVSDKRNYEWNADVYSVKEYYLDKGDKVWVVDVDKNIIGFGCICRKEADTAEIKRVRIDRRHRRNGWGAALIKRIESDCLASDISKLLVDTDERFLAAKSMYKRMGYTFCRTETEVIDGREYTECFYEKDL